MGDTWYSKTNETIIPGNPDRIKAWWDPLQYLNVAKYFKVFNEYPRDFNPRVHGPYCPWRYYGKRKNVYTVAKNVMEKGLQYKYVGRKLKKREYRALWIARINAAVREEGLTYSEFIHKLNEKGVGLDRKILADLAMNEPESFKKLVASVK